MIIGFVVFIIDWLVKFIIFKLIWYCVILWILVCIFVFNLLFERMVGVRVKLWSLIGIILNFCNLLFLKV